MKKITFLLTIVAFAMLCAFALVNATNWQIKNGYSIKFAGSSAEGEFEKVNGDIAFDANNLSASVMRVNVDVASIATGNWLKNRHAKGENWFDADKYPTISFTSSDFSKSATGFIVNGALEMHGVKKQISIPFSFVNNVFIGSFTVNRLDYGVGTLEGMSKKVSNAMKLEILVPVIKK